MGRGDFIMAVLVDYDRIEYQEARCQYFGIRGAFQNFQQVGLDYG